MKPNTSPRPSPETQRDAMHVAKATQRPGQTKEQTKLIAQGIEKGIALYKKQHKEKLRQADKAKKKQQSISEPDKPIIAASSNEPQHKLSARLPWILLALSWFGFFTYLGLW